MTLLHAVITRLSVTLAEENSTRDMPRFCVHFTDPKHYLVRPKHKGCWEMSPAVMSSKRKTAGEEQACQTGATTAKVSPKPAEALRACHKPSSGSMNRQCAM